tara:strand:+ start:987 stop:1367 length:381 start_codon:yes stop_codon:yes gene_type:complete
MKKKILINVEPTYLEEHSDPFEDSYLWAYRVIIKNNSEQTVKLISRHWKIFDSNGSYREVKGKGVVGEQPVLEPGEEFEYTSGTPLKTTSGMMHGSYLMQNFEGEEFEVNIPPFSLDIPDRNKTLN